MKIIRKGDPGRAGKTVRFTCGRCGCVFDAERGEYETSWGRNETVYHCRCPCCNNSLLSISPPGVPEPPKEVKPGVMVMEVRT